MENRFELYYQKGDAPWNIKRPDFNLVQTVNKFGILPCKAIDIGCGTGDNVFWLARHGFDASGIDYSETAIKTAQSRAKEQGIDAGFFVEDILSNSVNGGPYKFVFDRGCFHTMQNDKERRKFAKHVNELLEKGGQWLSLIGNLDDGRVEIGPPKRSARDIVEAVEPWFRIINLSQSLFDSNDSDPSKIWVCLMEKRG